jgi:hypothetical protein
VCLVGELAQRLVAFALGGRERVGRCRTLALGGLLLLGGRGDLGLEVLGGARDRSLDELAVRNGG